MLRTSIVCLCLVHVAWGATTHPAMRTLPVASKRPRTAGPAYFVDAGTGDDRGDGSSAKPWLTIGHAVRQLKPGDTLYLHGGVYFEQVDIAATGTAAAPITIRSAPGELAIIDGGYREFYATPKAAWQPVSGDEYQSTNTYPDIRRESSKAEGEDRGVWIVGNFADSMVPLHGYRYEVDFRSKNELWNLPDKSSTTTGVYLGPGVWFDWTTHRIHVRLAHTTLKSQGTANYGGETDPRKLQLVIAADRVPLRLNRASFVQIQDLVIRGSAVRTVDISGSDHISLDGVTIYGGSPALYLQSSHHVRVVRSAVRGLAAPWSSRASMKYRGNSPYLVIADSHAPQSHDWEIAYDELTDGHDGLVLDSIKTLRFHHNLVDNFNDDGIYLTLPPRQSVPEDVQIYENYVSRVVSALAFAQAADKSANTIGPGIFIFRNVFDLRVGTYAWPAKDAATAERPRELLPSRMCGDHGSPTWDPLFFYHNTVVIPDAVVHGLYGAQLVMGSRGTKRRLFDNIFIQLDGALGMTFPPPTDDLQADGNLLWVVKTGAAGSKPHPADRGTHDIYADPQLASLADKLDARLTLHSPAIDAGIAIPADWPDSLRRLDKGKPDIGALPFGAEMLRVGPVASP